MKILIVSIKPEFAEKIFNGQKSIELRKSAPNVSPGDMMVIYCTDPVKAVVGICQVKEILRMKPSRMWKTHNCLLGIDKKRYEQYFENVDTAIGIVLTSISRLDRTISLSAIKEAFPMFHPPQTFRYFTKSQIFKAYLRNDIASGFTN
ncbi:ASCH domain-containing protein [Longitalea luteola]|uniref:ASCH domain-containing protein n=1 Tax=Longitalea luteola TaxID=2812563 RepID=UPI001A97BD6E|nr:ASCH domain-containing protein [Longitalea luteola]